MIPLRRAALLLAGTACLTLAAQPAAAVVPERFELGINSGGDSCSAARQWTEGSGGIRLASEQRFTITCRGVAAAEAQAYVAPPGRNAGTERCGEPLRASIAGLGAVEVRRCLDAILARPAVDLRLRRNGKTYQGAAVETALGPLEAALKVIAAGAQPPSSRAMMRSTIDLAQVPPGPQLSAQEARTAITAESALADGIAALQEGRSLDASRILNDALRAFIAADASTKLDLRLAAGLADSNLSQFDAADAHFVIAQLLLNNNPDLPQHAYKQQQLATYRGVHLINQRRWDEAIDTLSRAERPKDLQDPMTLSQLNQETAAGRNMLQSSLTDASLLQRSLLEAQREWAISVAELALGRIAEADAALAKAAELAREPVRALAPERIAWMRAAIERQKGRIEARRGDIEASLASFDCAIGALKGGRPSESRLCVFRDPRELSGSALNAPLLVEAQLERASIESRDPAKPREAVLRDYGTAVQSLANLTGTGSVSLGALDRYFELLIGAPATPERDEEYFRAMQTIGEPAIAREYAQLQKVVSADPAVADLLRQRSDLERQLIRLRYEITASTGAAQAELQALEIERGAADARLAEVNRKLLAANGIGALEDQPATIASLRDALAPGEVYLKLTALRSSMFAIAIDRERTSIYRLPGSLPEIETLAAAVLKSARTDEEGVYRPYDVAGAERLFEIIAGPARPMLAAATKLVYNPAGLLRQFPPAILVTDPASVQAYAQQTVKGDYSQVAFLARKAESATALSPRAFLRARKELAPSAAPRPFLGLGENAPPELASGAAADRPMPFDCSLTYAVWASAVSGRKPISAHEIGVAAQALGIGGAEEIVGTKFTDSNLVEGPAGQELSQYQVLHFATHGIPETRVNVDQCTMHLPPALVTTLAAPSADGPVVSDGLLSFDEVARLRLNANLVVLSACETFAGASGAVARRGGLEDSTPALDGLVRSFIVANARNVLATFWRIPASVQSEELMAAFYGAGRTQPLGTALRLAQNSLLQQPRYSHPYYWGAYFLVGDGSKSMLTAPRTASRSGTAPAAP